MDREFVPSTVDELLEYCSDRGMPLEKMRFFIDEDYREPRAFGIYRDEDGDFVVYKNKASGERAIRYKGPDEEFAVHELYQKLRSEIAIREVKKDDGAGKGKKGNWALYAFLGIIAAIIILIVTLNTLNSRGIIHLYPRDGYYSYHNDYYYYDSGYWYIYDDILGWDRYSEGFSDRYDDYYDYYISDGYSYSYGVDDFRDSDYYGYYDWDWDYDWDYDTWDSWDSWDTDWDSDW